jgi:hypothetical protein
MSRRSLGGVLVALGLILAALSALADQIGIGDEAAFGWQQIGGLVVGLLVAIAGLIITRTTGKPSNEDAD